MNKKYKYVYVVLLILLVVLLVYYVTNRKEGFQVITVSDETYDIPFYIERTNQDAPSMISGVPLILYQSWHSNSVPAKMKETIYNLIQMNPEFDYYLYSDDESSKYIQENFEKEVLDAFNSLRPGAYKSDLWRYCILYKKGGVYIDIKYTTLKPLTSIIKDNPIVYVNDHEVSCPHLPNTTGLYNGFMISPPNNSVMKYCIDDIVNSCKLRLYKKNDLDITGPCLLAQIVAKYSPNYKSKFRYRELKDRQAVIYFNDEQFCLGYREYRAEQKKFQKSERYGFLWKKRAVYN
jgi:mannosyltransferase OCH1-like enzyme